MEGTLDGAESPRLDPEDDEEDRPDMLLLLVVQQRHLENSIAKLPTPLQLPVRAARPQVRRG